MKFYIFIIFSVGHKAIMYYTACNLMTRPITRPITIMNKLILNTLNEVIAVSDYYFGNKKLLEVECT